MTAAGAEPRSEGTARAGAGRLRLGMALAAGLATPCAFAPYHLWPLALLMPAVLLATITGLVPRAAAACGFAFGLGLFGHGVWWIQVSVHQFGLPYYAFSVSMTALFVAAMALYPALFATLVAMTRHRLGATAGNWLAAPVWVLVESLRGWFVGGFPWLSLGYSQLDSPLAGFAPLAGEASVSLAVMLGACALEATLRRRRPAALLVLATLLAGGYWLGRIDFTRVETSGLRAALVQGAVPQSLKWDPGQRARNIERYVELSEPWWGVDVMVWPETAIPAFPFEVTPLLERLRHRAAGSNTTLLVGMPTGEPWNGGEYYNSLVALGASNGRYDKRHLVPFGEYFPLKGLVGGLAQLLHIPMSDFSAGDAARATITVGERLAGASICYEDAFGREVISALPEAAFLVNVSNDAWFGDTIAPHQHLEIARMRALESGRYLLRGTNTGITAVIDERGRVVARAPTFTPSVLGAEFEARSGATPYVRLGDAPLLVVLALVVILAWLRAHRRVDPAGAR